MLDEVAAGFLHPVRRVRSAEGFFAVMAALGGTNMLRTHEVDRVVPVLEVLRLCLPT